MMWFGIYAICLIVFPMGILFPIKKNYNATEMLDKNDSLVIKGIAICFVMLAHLISLIELENDVTLLRPFTVLGGMGVLLFFFLSGYGLFKGYANREPEHSFVKKRIKNVVYPYVLMKTAFYIIFLLLGQPFKFRSILTNYLDWFIVVIIIQYMIFYLTWVISQKKSRKVLVFFNFILNIIIALVFWKAGLEERWYNGLILFPIGMLIAMEETRLISFFKSIWPVKLIGCLFLFILLGLLFNNNKGVLWADLVKSLAGCSLALFVCCFFVKYKLKSPVMVFIGKRSLYFYIVHLNIMHILTEIYNVPALIVFYFVLIFTVIIVEGALKMISFTENNIRLWRGEN